MTLPSLVVHDLGRAEYDDVLELQRALCRARVERRLDSDVLLLVEHPPVVTLGRGTRASSLPHPRSALEARGIAVREVERGGDVTYHGPGQLVGYPIVDLRSQREDLHWYLRLLEGALIDALATLDVSAERRSGLTGVWTAGRKIASIGIHVKQWVTFHGFALNVVTDLSAFDLIVPCGIEGVQMTSVLRERGAGDDPGALWSAACDAVASKLATALGATSISRPPEYAELIAGPATGPSTARSESAS